ncbi:MAG: hypothetical protein LBE84_09025 [Planctomycetota bacterium]|nr:hypothetical protein [Planctomycetota bacterium]
MAEAGIPVYDEYGRKADFHCLRTSTGTLLSSAGVPLATVQKMMRHSTPILTAKHYIRLSIVDKAAALAKMPDFHPAGPDAEGMRATGTDGEIVDRKFDSNGDEKGLFPAVNCYKQHKEINCVFDALELDNSIKNQDVK